MSNNLTTAYDNITSLIVSSDTNYQAANDHCQHFNIEVSLA